MPGGICGACGTSNDAGRKFCGECGASLTGPAACGACGTPYTGTEKFCGECGARREGVPTAAGTPVVPGQVGSAPAAPSVGTGEVRQVSVLFVDLVGYTALSEGRDPEDVRSLLSQYFETARVLIERYGGRVEKFIGDAVMAVWGSPVAREDDADRAVRAALDVVAAVPTLAEGRAPTNGQRSELRARAGIVTGQAAAVVNPAEGLVVGDRVNTAARVQSAAEPGTVLVDDTTRGLTHASIAYVDAGSHTVKGKAAPVHLWQATRVVADRSGAMRIDGLEAGFVGHVTELALVKTMLHDSIDRRTARLVTVSGQAGVGKSRLAWEFDKYTDGIATMVLWHTGRCLSYGDSIAYGALAEVMRQRFGIAEDEASDAVRAKVADGLARYVDDPAERDFLIPRVGRLLGLDDGLELGREELFSGWRLLLERMTDTNPVVLVIEDAQWADTGLLDFLEHLLDWSAQYPLFVLLLTRPDLLDRRPDWTAGRRNATTVYLEPLTTEDVGTLLEDLVPGLPTAVKRRIAEQSAGVPLYAVETIRALIDRDYIVPRNGVYTLVADLADLSALEVPASLTSLLAARLDALPPDARTLLRRLSVFRGSFPRSAAGAVAGTADAPLDALLADLVHRDLLGVRADPLSPQRGQYGFTQEMLRSVAYDTLARTERKALHLAAAAHLRTAFPDDADEIIDVVAAHYQAALAASAGTDDERDVRRLAFDAHVRAAERASLLGASEAAQLAFQAGATLADDEQEAARLLERAGVMARNASRSADAGRLLTEAAATHEAAGRVRDAARLRGLAAQWQLSATEELDALRDALAVLELGERDEVYAEIALLLGRRAVLQGAADSVVLATLDEALTVAEALDLPDLVANGLVTKGNQLNAVGRHVEATALFTFALDVALESSNTTVALDAYGNLTDMLLGSDRPGLEDAAQRGIALARRLGVRGTERILLANLWLHELFVGRWEELETAAREKVAAGDVFGDIHTRLAVLEAWRGRPAAAEPHVRALTEWLDGDDLQDREIARAAVATVHLAGGRPDDALSLVSDIVTSHHLGLRRESFRVAWPTAVDAALAVGRSDDVDQLLAVVGEAPPGHVPPYLRAQLARFRALRDMSRAPHAAVDEADAELRSAIAGFTDLGYPYWLARAQQDLAGCASRRGDPEAAARLRAAADAALADLGVVTSPLAGAVPA